MSESVEINLMNTDKKAKVSACDFEFINQFDWFMDHDGYCRTMILFPNTKEYTIEKMEYFVVYKDKYLFGYETGDFIKADLDEALVQKLLTQLSS